MNKVIGTLVLALAASYSPLLRAPADRNARSLLVREKGKQKNGQSRTPTVRDARNILHSSALSSMCRARNEGAVDWTSTQFGSREDSVQA
jgi:hypothetical protein